MFGLDKQRKLGVQLYHYDIHGIACEITSPDEQLSYLVDYYWKLTVTLSKTELQVIPDNAIDLVISPQIEQFAALYLPVEKSFSIPLSGPVIYAGISFRPEPATQYFALPLNHLEQLSAGVDTIDQLKIHSLLRSVQSITNFEALADIFNTHLLQSCRTEQVMESRNILDLLADNSQTNCIASVARLAGLSERQLRRVADHAFGLGPKKLQRVIRLQQTLHELFDADNAVLADTFYDDSHRIRELKKMTGLTPGQIRSLAEIYNTAK